MLRFVLGLLAGALIVTLFPGLSDLVNGAIDQLPLAVQNVIR